MHPVAAYEQIVMWAQESAPGADKFVHVCAGLALWLALAWLAGRGLRSPLPLLGVAVCEAANEVIDRIAHGRWAWRDTGGDVLATLFWPVVICLLLQSARMRHGAGPTTGHHRHRAGDHHHHHGSGHRRGDHLADTDPAA